jgi:hypothetical protein
LAKADDVSGGVAVDAQASVRWASHQSLRKPFGDVDSIIVFLCLSTPCLLFYFFIGRPVLGLCLTALVLLGFQLYRAGASTGVASVQARSGAVSIACALAAFALTTIGGEGRVFPATNDWLIRDAVLHDVVRLPWPFVYHFDGKDWLLRAPLAMYLAPAAIGKLIGLKAAIFALWAQNTAAIFAVLRILCASMSVARSLTVLAAFCIFSGWDVIGALITHHGLAPPVDIEWWDFLFQYSSTMTLAFWVPNHALAGWFVAALILLWDKGQIRIGALAMGAALSAFWSPFALIGAAPFLAKAGIEALARRRIAWGDVGMPLLLGLALAPLALFLVSDSGAVPHGFQPMSRIFILFYALFISLELLPFLAANWIPKVGNGGFSRSTYFVAVASLMLMPFYSLGPGNDFVMRASIPALAVVAVTTGHSAYAALKEQKVWKVALVGLALTLGGLTGLVEIWRIVTGPNLGTSQCDLVQAWDQDPRASKSMAHYLADADHVGPLLRRADAHLHPTGPTIARSSDQRL